MTDTLTPEDVTEGLAIYRDMQSEDVYTRRPEFYSKIAMHARQRRGARSERALPVFTADDLRKLWYVGDDKSWEKLADAINASIVASGFTTEAAIQARIDAAVLAEREACDFIAQWNEAPHVANLIRARTTNPEITTPDIAPYGGFNCGNCRFMVENYGHILGLCHRYPETIEFNANHWCGEHKSKDAGR